MVRRSRSLHALFTCWLLAATVTTAAAHCCHDERSLATAQQSEFRRGVHGMGDGLGDDEERDPPSIGSGLDRGTGSLGNGGFGRLQGNSLGNYGAGSLGERGPGGLGTLHGDSVLTQPPRPR